MEGSQRLKLISRNGGSVLKRHHLAHDDSAGRTNCQQLEELEGTTENMSEQDMEERERLIRAFEDRNAQEEEQEPGKGSSQWRWDDLVKRTGKIRFRLVSRPLFPVEPSDIEDDLFQSIETNMLEAAEHLNFPEIEQPEDIWRALFAQYSSQQKASENFIRALLNPLVVEQNGEFLRIQVNPKYMESPSHNWLPKDGCIANYVVCDRKRGPLGVINPTSINLLGPQAVIQNMLQVRALWAQEEGESEGDQKKPGVFFGIVTDAIHFYWFLLDEEGVFQFTDEEPHKSCSMHHFLKKSCFYLDRIRTWEDVRRVAAKLNALFTLRDDEAEKRKEKGKEDGDNTKKTTKRKTLEQQLEDVKQRQQDFEKRLQYMEDIVNKFFQMKLGDQETSSAGISGDQDEAYKPPRSPDDVTSGGQLNASHAEASTSGPSGSSPTGSDPDLHGDVKMKVKKEPK